MRRAFALIGALVLVSVASPSFAQDFARREGTSFYIGDAPFRFVGANAAVMHGPIARANYLSTLDAIAHDGLQVVRIWAFGEIDADAPAWQDDYGFRRGPNNYLATSFEHLDRVLVAARERGLRAIVVLGNRWGDYGGARAQLRWCGETLPDQDADGATLATYWSNERGRDLYLDHVVHVIDRVNSVSSVAYRDDPTIFAWELINESGSHTMASNDALVAWTQHVAQFIRARDSHHMIAAGHIGYRTVRQREVWARIQALPEIDYADAHGYPEEDARVQNVRALREYVDDRLALSATVVQKPFVWGEFGYRLTTRRAQAEAMDEVFLRRSLDGGAAGALIWIYAPPGVVRDGHGIEVGAESPTQLRLRRLLSRYARRFARTQAADASQWARAPRAPLRQRVALRGASRQRTSWTREGNAFTADVDPRSYVSASFEAAGEYVDGDVTQVWGAGDGVVTYRVTSPEVDAPASLTVELFATSELPGRGIGATERDTSTVRVFIDDREVGSFEMPPDRGEGSAVRFVLDDADQLRAIFGVRQRAHNLTFSTENSPGAGGICLYMSSRAEAPPPLRLVWQRRTP